MDWRRSELSVSADVDDLPPGEVIASISLRSFTQTGKLRVGLWAGGERLAGWVVPVLPPHLVFIIRGNRAYGLIGGERRELSGRILDWDGVRPPRDQRLPQGTYRLTLDQEPDKVVPVSVSVSFATVVV